MTQGSAILRKAWQGKWALVTGASAGIGEAFAVELAAAGVNLVLTARRKDRLEAIAARLAAEYKVQVKIIVADLEQPDAPEKIFAETEGAGLTIDVLVNNAGFGYYGEFGKGDPARQAAMVQVNCTAVVVLTNLFLPKMMERRRGDILLVASTASYQPVAYLATYAATKVFDRFLAEAIAEEVKKYGIRVSALCPGPDRIGVRRGRRRQPQPDARIPKGRHRRPPRPRRPGARKTLGHPVSRRPGRRLRPALHAPASGHLGRREGVSSEVAPISADGQSDCERHLLPCCNPTKRREL